MNYTDEIGALPAVLVVVVGFIGLVWLVLSFFAPFFWYGTWKRSKEISEKMTTLIETMRRRP